MIVTVLTIATKDILDSEGVSKHLFNYGKEIAAEAKGKADVEVFVFNDPHNTLLKSLRQLVNLPTR